MESYRLRATPSYARRKLLLPVSGGVSSTVLLSILHQHLQRQLVNSRGLAAYDLHVLVVETSSFDAQGPTAAHVNLLEDAYPGHTYHSSKLSDIFVYEKNIDELLCGREVSPAIVKEAADYDEVFNAFLESFSSPMSRNDVRSVLLQRLIVAIAKSKGCDAILWGDSDSRLASKALAGVAKGRGSSLPFQTCDGPSVFGVNFKYPLRDLFKSELLSYASIVNPHNEGLILPGPVLERQVSASTSSIDDLMAQYIASQGEKYPSIMANVVRTVAKLEAPQSDESHRCGFCGMPDTPESPSVVISSRSNQLCYGCSRLVEEF